MMDRSIEFKKYPDRLRSWCTRKKCTFACVIRYGSYGVEGDEEFYQGIRTLFAHSCIGGRSIKEPCNYTTTILAHILIENVKGTDEINQKQATTILNKYTKRPLCYSTISKVRSLCHSIILGEKLKRINLFPAYIERLREEGHKVDYGTVDAQKMREFTFETARSQHDLRYKSAHNPPKFDENQVDISASIHFVVELYF